MRRFGAWDASVQLRFTTKYDNVQPLLGLPHGRRTRIRFSVNAAAMEKHEGGTPRMPARLGRHAPRGRQAGYRIGLTVAPIMPVPDWEAEYGELLADAGEALARAVAAGGTEPGSTGTVDPDLTVELITHRFTDASKAVLRGWYPGSPLDMDETARSRKLTKFGGGKWVYPAGPDARDARRRSNGWWRSTYPRRGCCTGPEGREPAAPGNFAATREALTAPPMRLKLYRAPSVAQAMAQIPRRAGRGRADPLDPSRGRGRRGLRRPGTRGRAACPAAPARSAAAWRIPAFRPRSTRRAPPRSPYHGVQAGLSARLDAGSLADALAAALRWDALPLAPDGPPLLLLGPPGAGKTLTTARLATRLVLAGTRPLVVSADGKRAGAAEQLAAFTRLLGVPLLVADNPVTLRARCAGARRPRPC